ncbi:hypothetical protein CERSUDRAFT_114040 [Gelatoporia subvermispora B]|uniref:DUF1793-domain-containing protein n=1 Tax=Ceriporiopsis subvermispora (strain B) TaxID=914234 RepID=M2RFY4_CERS8|nr:hypothetical protein CERSUDRAFT_114040 [Gelatoporia subvermispora B]
MVILLTLHLLLIFALPCLVRSQNNAAEQTFWPSAIPLAVRSPYLSGWMMSTANLQLLEQWSRFWNYASPSRNNAFLTLQGLVTIDGTLYQWLGDWNFSGAFAAANLTKFSVTPTRTIFEMQAGPMSINITFLSPIEPSDWASQSVPYSYVYMDTVSTDGQYHDVKVYADVSAEWVTGNRDDTIIWNTTVTSSAIYHAAVAANPTILGETADQANDGTLYLAMTSTPSVTYQTGFSTTCRDQFFVHGALANSQDTDFRSVYTNQPSFALSADLGSIMSTSAPVVWVLAYVRDPTIGYVTPDGDSQQRHPYFVTKYTSSIDAVLDALVNFNETVQRAQSLDNKIIQDALKISPQYADLVSLAARQVFGATEITVSNGSDRQWNISDTLMFMKDIGNTRRVNPVEVLYQAFPMFLYLNSSFGKLLLAPLLEYQSSPKFPLPYAAADLGNAYPQALGNNSGHSQGLEQTGNMLIMTYAHARMSGDGSLISKYYDMLRGWAEYLSNNTLHPTASQQSADQQSISNSSNLSVKGIIAIQAMAEMSQAIGKDDDAVLFGQRATQLMSEWDMLAYSSDQSHVLMDYGDESSWALMYNLYPDRLLGTNLINSTIYQKQTSFYGSLASGNFGLGINSAQNTTGNSAWMLFYGAAATESDGLQSLISMAWNHASSNQSRGVFPTMYNLSGIGNLTGGSASPAQGAMFAPLALSVANKTIVVPSTSSSSPSISFPSDNSANNESKSVNVGAIVGGVVGGLGVIGCLIGAFVLRSRSKTRRQGGIHDMAARPVPFLYDMTVPPEFYVSKGAQPFNIAPNNPSSREGLRVIPPSKRRDVALDHGIVSRPTPGALVGPEVTAPPLSSIDPPAHPTASNVNMTSLRTEVRTQLERLRRALDEIQADRMEPPPGYTG